MTTYPPNDYRQIALDFEAMFGNYRTTAPTNFAGPNFMTPDVLGVLAIGGTVEVSYGTGFDHEPIFGVTWNRLADNSCDPRDRLCYSLDEVRTVLMDVHGHRAHGAELP